MIRMFDDHAPEIDMANLLPSVVNGYDIDEAMDNLWMEAGTELVLPDGSKFYDIRSFEVNNPLLTEPWFHADNIVECTAQLCRDPNYIHFITKYILNINLLPYQCVILNMLWHKPLPMLIASRGAGKSYLLSVYIVVRALLHQGCKICVVGGSLRQSMVLFNYIQNIWDNSPILQDICGGKKNSPKRDIHICTWKCGDSVVNFLPLGNGEKIRGQRANIIISDEYASIPAQVFETVVRGFAAVKSDGVHLNVAKAYKGKIVKYLGKASAIEYAEAMDEILDQEEKVGKGCKTKLDGNQIVIAGTASYRFNHFYKYFNYYRSIILSGGDPEILKREFPDMPIPKDLDPGKYGIIRLPYDKVPEGMMDSVILSQGRATMDPQIFDMEYGCIFPNDSEGFYLASWLQQCTCPVNGIMFLPKIFGDKDKEYVMGVDPASEDDNFAINIIEINDGYRAVVYQWTTNRKDFEDARRIGAVKEEIQDYNTFIIRHMRDLMRRFNINLIVMDTGGGGVSVREGLRDPDKLLDDRDEIILDMDDEMTQGLPGRRILKMIEFVNYKWRVDAHHGLRKDILEKKILFPCFDIADMAVGEVEDDSAGRVFDTLGDCYLEIEQCKQETTLIQHSHTTTHKEKWDIPSVIGVDANANKKALKKDRFSSLLLSNWGCRILEQEPELKTGYSYTQFGGTAQSWDYSNEGAYKSIYVGKGTSGMKNFSGFNTKTPGNNRGGGRQVYY